jgi:hypothetical protein
MPGLPLALDGGVDNRVLFFCMALSVLTTVLFGFAPALQAMRTDVLPALKESGNTVSGGGHNWLRNALIVVQIAFSMILLVGGGLFERSVACAWSVDFGFRPAGLLTAEFSAPPPGAVAAERLRRAQQEILERLRTTPGVQSASLASSQPFDPIKIRTELRANGAAITVERHTVSNNFFHTVGFGLLSGREFERRQGDSAEGGHHKSDTSGALVAGRESHRAERHGSEYECGSGRGGGRFEVRVCLAKIAALRVPRGFTIGVSSKCSNCANKQQSAQSRFGDREGMECCLHRRFTIFGPRTNF